MRRTTYLMGMADGTTNVASALCRRLNEKKLRPKRKPFYTDDIVRNTLYEKTTDPLVDQELVDLIRDTKSPEDIRHKLKEAKAALREVERLLLQP